MKFMNRDVGIRRALSVAGLAAAMLCAAPVSATLIVNGSFEQPTVPVGGFTNFLGGSAAIPGWTVVGVDSSVISGSFTQNGILFQAQNGLQWVDLAGVNSNSTTSGLRQNVATIVGQLYELSFYVGSALDNRIFFPTTVDLSINGGARAPHFNANAPTDKLNWKLFTEQFTATSTTTSLAFFNGAASNNFLAGLDNVSLVEVTAAVPEPGNFVLVSLGLLALLARRRT